MRVIKSALLATGALLSMPAEAVTFIRYSVATVGSGSGMSAPELGGGRSYFSTINSTFVFTVGLSNIGGAGYTVTPTSEIFGGRNGNGFYTDSSFSGVARDYILTLAEQTFTAPGNRFTGSFLATACLDGTGTRFLRSYSRQNGCGSVNYLREASGSSETYRGVITDIRVELFDAESSSLGLTQVIPGVPEPATWALMLTGFAMTGYALRRRRAKVAFA